MKLIKFTMASNKNNIKLFFLFPALVSEHESNYE